MSFSRGLTVLGALLLISVVSAAGLAAQGAEARPLFIAIPDQFPEVEARAVVVRERGREIVLLKATDATAETLDVALALLRRVRERRVEPGRSVMVPIAGFAVRRPMSAETRRRLDHALGRLAAQPVARIGTLGAGRAIRYRDDRP